jgi:hypothetical protein
VRGIVLDESSSGTTGARAFRPTGNSRGPGPTRIAWRGATARMSYRWPFLKRLNCMPVNSFPHGSRNAYRRMKCGLLWFALRRGCKCYDPRGWKIGLADAQIRYRSDQQHRAETLTGRIRPAARPAGAIELIRDRAGRQRPDAAHRQGPGRSTKLLDRSIGTHGVLARYAAGGRAGSLPFATRACPRGESVVLSVLSVTLNGFRVADANVEGDAGAGRVGCSARALMRRNFRIWYRVGLARSVEAGCIFAKRG